MNCADNKDVTLKTQAHPYLWLGIGLVLVLYMVAVVMIWLDHSTRTSLKDFAKSTIPVIGTLLMLLIMRLILKRRVRFSGEQTRTTTNVLWWTLFVICAAGLGLIISVKVLQWI